jgi:hypothetical protein
MLLPNFLASLEGLANLFIISSRRFAVFDMLDVSEAPDCVEELERLEDGRICTGVLIVNASRLEYADAPPKVVFPFENG